MTAATRTSRLEAALARHRAGDLDGAIESYWSILAESPEDPDALNLLASALRRRGAVAEAVGLARRAARIAPDRADIRYNLGNALSAAGDVSAAAEAFEAALGLDPHYAEAAANLGIARAKLGDGEAAIAAYERALAIDPSHRAAALNLGNLLGEIGRHALSVERLRRVVADHPDLAEGHYNLGLALLRAGDYGQGFAAYEWRWRTPDFSSPVRHADIPTWDGSPFPGRRLLVHAEQGLGDTLQFVRFLVHARSLGGRVTLEVPTVLKTILQDLAGADEVTDRVEPGGHDLQVPLLGLPLRLGLTLGAVGMRRAYLKADPARVGAWRERLVPDGRTLVGLGWRGNPASPADKGRSIRDPAILAPLARIPGLRLIALHKLDRADLEPGTGPTGWAVAGLPFRIEHPGPDFDTGLAAFVDTAAVMMLCDRIVTTDTSLVHLAGALERPTDLLLKSVPDWRWRDMGETTPWYPTLRLVRQTTPGNFADCVDRIARRLAQEAGHAAAA